MTTHPVFLPPKPKMPARKKTKSLEVVVFENGYVHGMEDYDRDAISALIECIQPFCEMSDDSNVQFIVQLDDDKLVLLPNPL